MSAVCGVTVNSMLAWPASMVLARCDSSMIGFMTSFSTYGRGASQYLGLRVSVIWLSRCQLVSVNGPAPTGSLLKLLPLAARAVGDATYGLRATLCGNTPCLALSVIFSVWASTTSIAEMLLATAARLALLAGS